MKTELEVEEDAVYRNWNGYFRWTTAMTAILTIFKHGSRWAWGKMGRQTNWINMFLVLIHRLFSCFWTILLDASLLNVDLQLKLFLAVKIYAHFTSADPMQQCVSNLTCTTDLENTLKFYWCNLQYFSWDAAGIKKFLCCFLCFDFYSSILTDFTQILDILDAAFGLERWGSG